MRALLIRHAASSGQAPDAPLSDDGEAHAERLAPWLTAAGAGPLYSSPYRRARQTVAPFSKASGQEVTALDGLRERLLSPAPCPDWLEETKRSFTDPGYALPGGEALADVRARAAAALDEIAQKGGALPTFVTHGVLTTALFGAADPSFGFDDWRALRNPDVFAVTLVGGQLTTFERLDWKDGP
ncbi:MAG: histidine phosphatase family protein [Pseudomonadota bacterium]